MQNILSILLFLLCFANFAKDVPPALFVLEDPDSRTSKKIPLSITDFEAEVKIHGNLALTEITLTFRNHTNRNLEGEFYYPLPANSAITGYALDINGKMVDGVAVEKERATQVFNAIKARNIDPGLVEWENKNCFKTRVFPILPEKSRTIRVQYLTELRDNKYLLPLNFRTIIDRFRFKIEIFKPYPHMIRFKGRDDVLFKKEGSCAIAEFAEENKIPEKDIVIYFPRKKKELRVYTETQNGTTYFMVEDYPPIGEGSPITPEKLNIFWDISGSRGDDRHDLEMQLLKKFFAKFKNRTIEVNLTLFRHKLGRTRFFRVRKGNCKRLLSFLERVEYGGGTNFNNLDLAYGGVEDVDCHLLFSDGNSTFGNTARVKFKSPLYAISSGANVNAPFLKKLAAETGGDYFDLLKEKDVAEKIGITTASFISLEKSSSLIEAWPDVPTKVKGKFILTGKMMGEKATIDINYGVNGKEVFNSELQISREGAVNAGILSKFQAMKKLEDLMIYPRLNRSKIIKLGKKYGLVTPYTSLIVLENIDQYVQYGIIPPESEKQMRKEYFRKTGTARNPQMRLQKRMNFVTQAWKNRIMWWNTEFKYKPKFKYRKFRHYYNDYFESDESFSPDDTFSSGRSQTRNEFTIRNALIARIAPDDGGVGDFFGEDIESIDKKGKSENFEEINVSISKNRKPYLNALYNSDEAHRIDLYWKLRREYRKSPSFFLDCADFFHTQGDTDFAVLILSEIAELDFENEIIQRIIACKLDQMDRTGMAITILENEIKACPENPDIQLDLAMLYLKQAKSIKDSTALFYKKAFKLLYGLVTNSDVDKDTAALALMEINHLLPKAKEAGLKDLAIPLDLIHPLEADLRIVISRYSALEKMHFSIIEPSGENINTHHPLSLTGGYLSGGVGPEEYFVRKAMPGTYKIITNFQGDPIEKLFGAIILKVDIYTNYGRSTEIHNSALIHMKKSSKNVVIGVVKIK